MFYNNRFINSDLVIVMGSEKDVCDLCGLPIETPGFELKTSEGEKAFCCEGCKGIYQMLHEDEIVEESTTASSDN